MAVLAAAAACGARADVSQELETLDRIGRELAQARCPRPVEVKTQFIANPQSSEIRDEMLSYACRGMRVAVYRSNGPGAPREMPMALVVEEAIPRLPPPFSVGQPAAQVLARLGEPASRHGASLSYALPGAPGSRDRLTFEVSDGVVRVLSWTWQFD